MVQKDGRDFSPFSTKLRLHEHLKSHSQKKARRFYSPGFHSGAGERARTVDLNLGKVPLYQLSYTRLGLPILKPRPQVSSSY
jgi:hypothetical protein